MNSGFQSVPPWEGPDLLTDAREAARKAGEAHGDSSHSVRAKAPMLRRERTWADVEAECTQVLPRVLTGIQTPMGELPMRLQKVKGADARRGARVQAERTAGRHSNATMRGERKTKLTEVQVAEIWRSADTGAALAARYDVSAMTISNIRRGKRWGSLTVTLGAPGLPLRKS